MTSRDRLILAANIALNMLEEFISAMEQATNNLCDGLAPGEIHLGRHKLYMISYERQKTAACVWDSEDYFRIVESAALQACIRLDETDH
ncbi:MAG: hypothetical protein MUO26_04505 [Methanotrichaceae archaeon]|nr:hypothetical protein [Methanotrichaceae archaeon]